MKLWQLFIFLPVIGAFIGWTTKFMALQMVFKPAEFKGIGPIGWQGIVQRRAPKFASGIADTITETALSIDDIVDRLDAAELAGVVGPAIDSAAPDLAREVANAVKPGLWDEMAPEAQEMFVEGLKDQGRSLIAIVIDSIKPKLASALDVRSLVIDMLSGSNSSRLSDLVQTVGARELKFVVAWGAVLGGIIGLLEVGVYELIDKWWLLPIIGALDGLVNNWLAIQMIFKPREKIMFLGIIPWQGLFPARQEEIARDYAAMMAAEVLTPRNLGNLLMQNEASAVLMGVAFGAVEAAVAPQLEMLAMMAGIPEDDEMRGRVIAAIAPRATELIGPIVPELEEYLEKRLDIGGMLEVRLAEMPKEEFETVLRGIFEEDEPTLIGLGGVLGGFIGLLQAAIVVAVA